MFLIGMGLFGMAVGAALGLVGGEMHRDCERAMLFASAEPAPHTLAAVDEVCQQAALLRPAAFGLVGLSALVAGVPLVQHAREQRQGA